MPFNGAFDLARVSPIECQDEVVLHLSVRPCPIRVKLHGYIAAQAHVAEQALKGRDSIDGPLTARGSIRSRGRDGPEIPACMNAKACHRRRLSRTWGRQYGWLSS